MKRVLLAFVTAAFLAGCDSASEQAAKHLAHAQQLLDEGDTARAQVELRNALSKDESLVAARLLLAQILEQNGQSSQAFAQYRKISEQDPKNLEAIRSLALLALDMHAFDDAERYGNAALALAPDDADLQALAATTAYRKANLSGDTDGMEAAAKQARALLKADSKNLQARRVVVTEDLRLADLTSALSTIDEGLQQVPDDRDLHNMRLLVLTRQDDKPAIEAEIRKMITLWPEDETLDRVLVQFYLQANRSDEAEAWLKGRIDPSSDKPQTRMVYLRFLAQLRSTEAMRDALTQMLDEKPLPHDIEANLAQFRALRAGADFTLGQRDQGMSEMESILDGVSSDDKTAPETENLRIQLAQMRLTAGNPVGSRALVEQVLKDNPEHVAALKMKSSWLIDEDKTDDAVATLRSALANAPNDAQVLTLMAKAYQREGRNELMADMLARAVETSNQGVDESLRYARYLAGRQGYGSAETVLVDALRRKPVSQPLLTTLAQVHLAMKDWGRMQQDIKALRERFPNDANAQSAADELQAQMLTGQGRDDDLGRFLEGLSSHAGGSLGPQIAIIRNSVRQGQADVAYQDAQKLVTDYPDAPEAIVLLAQLEALRGETDAARTRMTALTEAHPDFETGWQAFYGLEMQARQPDAAQAVLTRALAALPDSRALNMLQAGRSEQAGDIDAAIAIYEKLYAANSNDVIVANNLASLLASTRSDKASLDRAWTVARRLNGSKEPAFRDTYGWLAFLRGQNETAVSELQAAATGLPKDPSVAYHYGRALAKAGEAQPAQAQYQRASDLLANGAHGYPGLKSEIDQAQQSLVQ
ncbi:tetratricopeptide repeat protein (plasmid) [Thioclava litoralis]|uniref:Tetratricopeptide repeat protein n=1 Tax=Thioclava litoralis TaxID=3076557 RepID=A0ABZ1E6E2_9RHOB|nr:tetratricopeptide repeat protein [Thioclava sp. FTW29]